MYDQNAYLASLTVIDANGCWIWTGSTSSGGYGQFRDEKTGKMALLHRYVWVGKFGPIPVNADIYHKCPNRACCNPAHLTRSRYERHHPERGLASGIVRGSKHHKAKLDEGDVEVIRFALTRGVTQKEIAKQFNVTQATISRIKSELSWRRYETRPLDYGL